MEVKRRRPRKIDNSTNRHSSRFTRSRSSPSNSDSSSVDNRQDTNGSNAVACSPSSSNGSIIEQKPKRRGRVPTKGVSTKRPANSKSIENRRRKRPKKKAQSQV